MTRVIRTIHQDYMRPMGETVALSISLNRQIWTGLFGRAWDSLRLDEKLIWIAFISNTICIFTLIEFLFLKK